MELLLANLLSPVVLSFFIGIVAKWIKSDLSIPSVMYQAISIYLLFAIGIKGGVAIQQTPLSELILPIVATLVLGCLTPLIAFFFLRKLGKCNLLDASATAAHYGSVSAVTFLAALDAGSRMEIRPEGYLPALVAILEVPGIIVGLLLARLKGGQNSSDTMPIKPRQKASLGRAIHEIVTGKSIILLVGGLLIGAISSPESIDLISPFFKTPFYGVLCLFMLELGLVAASRFQDIKNAGIPVVLCGIILPIINGSLGVMAGTLAGMNPSGAAVFGALTGSASYIAAPAAVRIALPKASPGIYLMLALGVTFPFNLTLGIPLYYKCGIWFSQLLGG